MSATQKESFKRRVVPFAMVAAIAAAAAGGYHVGQEKSPEAPVAATALPNVTMLEMAFADTDFEDATSLNNWLRANPHKKVTGLAAVDNVSLTKSENAYQVFTTDGSNVGQHFSFVDVPLASYQDALPAAEVQTWINEHPRQQIDAITALPGSKYGGTDGYT